MLIRYSLRILGALLLSVILLLMVLSLLPSRWIAEKAEVYGSDLLNAELSIGTLDLKMLSMTPSISVQNVQVQPPAKSLNGANVDIGRIYGSLDLWRLVRGDIVIDELTLLDADMDFRINSDGVANWSYLVPEAGKVDSRTEPGSMSIPSIRSIDIQNVNVGFEDAKNQRSAQLALQASGSTIDTNQPTMLSMQGSVNGLAADVSVEVSSLATLQIPPESLEVDVEARIGSSKLALGGQVAYPASAENLDVEFSLSGDGLEDFETISGIELPSLPPFSLSSDLFWDGEELVLRRFDGVLGDSDIEGDIRVNPNTSPISLYANVISRKLDLDDLAGLLGATPDSAETVTEIQQQQAKIDADDAQLLPDRALDLRPVIAFFNGAVRFRANSVTSPSWPIDSMEFQADIEDTDVSIAPLRIGLAGGKVSGAIYLDMAAMPMKSQLELEIERVNLRQVLSSVGIDDDSFGLLGGRSKFWMTGDSVAELAASADGGLFLLMTKGRLDALLAEIAGIDLTESLILLIDPEKTRTDINCAYLDMLSKDGIAEISTLVMDTDDSVLLAGGSINLNDESVDLIIEPHPKDTSILAAQTAAHISGIFTDLQIVPGRTLYARAAAVALLATIATPAAA